MNRQIDSPGPSAYRYILGNICARTVGCCQTIDGAQGCTMKKEGHDKNLSPTWENHEMDVYTS